MKKMAFTIRLSCVLVMLFCLSSTGNAGNIDRDRRRLEELQTQSKHTIDPNAQLRITHETVEIYKRYRGQVESDAAEETDLNEKVKDFETKIVFVEGVPPQGGFLDIIKGAADSVPDEVKEDAKDLAESAGKALFEGLTKYLLAKFTGCFGLGK